MSSKYDPVKVQNHDESVTTSYVTVNVNTTGTTELLNPSNPTVIHGVFYATPTASSAADLELTDGSSTGKLEENGDDSNIEFSGPLPIDSGQTLQANVTSSDTDTDGTAVVVHSTRENLFDQ